MQRQHSAYIGTHFFPLALASCWPVPFLSPFMSSSHILLLRSCCFCCLISSHNVIKLALKFYSLQLSIIACRQSLKTCLAAAGKLLAVALLDSTIKIFFTDTLKFFLSLYGHKLPVLSMDISSDSTLLVSGAADKNIKIWGLDFGDCHRSLFAHDDSVMQVSFVHNTHYVFTAGESCTFSVMMKPYCK